MRRDPKSLLWDAKQAADAIAAMIEGKQFADFDRDIILRSAVERQFEIIGEALGRLARLDPSMGERIPDLRAIVGLRNILIHGYAMIDRARLWQTAAQQLPKLAATLETLLPPPP